MRAEVQLRTSVKVYREMPGLRKTLYDAATTPELLDDLVTRVFGNTPPPKDPIAGTGSEAGASRTGAAEAGRGSTSGSGGGGGGGIMWPDVGRGYPRRWWTLFDPGVQQQQRAAARQRRLF